MASVTVRCIRCDGLLDGVLVTHPCPHCGAKKAAGCEVCGLPIYLGRDTCEAHSVDTEWLLARAGEVAARDRRRGLRALFTRR